MRTIVIFLASAFGIASATPGFDRAELERLFRWGEFDSLASLVISWSASPESELDSAFPVAMAYLGVAHHVNGDTARGDTAFTLALQRMPDLRLDRRYVNATLHARFRGLADRLAMEPPASTSAAPEASLDADISRTSGDSPAGTPAAAAAAAKAKSGNRRRINPWVYIGSGAGLAAAGGAAYILLQSPPVRQSGTFIDLR